MHRDLLEQFENFTEYFDSSVLFDQCVTVLFQLVTAGVSSWIAICLMKLGPGENFGSRYFNHMDKQNLVVPIKEVVIRCLCQFLRRLRRSDYREQVFRLLQGKKFVYTSYTLLGTQKHPTPPPKPNPHRQLKKLPNIPQPSPLHPSPHPLPLHLLNLLFPNHPPPNSPRHDKRPRPQHPPKYPAPPPRRPQNNQNPSRL